jgi:membrane protein YqaA with SNARE-associated domain
MGVPAHLQKTDKPQHLKRLLLYKLIMLDGFIEYGYIGLFIASFLAATILPFGSEFIFITLIAMGLDPWICTIVASIGNWLGGMTNYYLGMLGKIEWIEKYLKTPKERIDRIQRFLEGKGAAMAFFSFLPVVGDVIAIALGYMRANVYIVNISMFIGKFARYLILMYGMGMFW